MRFKGKVVLITGGTSGIGRAAAELFAAEGARVALTGRRVALGEQVAREIGGRFIVADHRLAEECGRSVAEAMESFGRLDILFNNAGIVPRGTAEATTEEVWQETMLLNVTAVWRMCRRVLPIMRAQGGGVIINNASDWGLVGGREAVAYCVSKGAVVQMTRAMALDHARENIRVNAVCPGDTFVQRWIEDGYFDEDDPVETGLAQLGEALPIGRVGTAGEVARAVLFLASDDAGFITGAMLAVDGGNTAQ